MGTHWMVDDRDGEMVTCPDCDGWSPDETGMLCATCDGDGVIWEPVDYDRDQPETEAE